MTEPSQNLVSNDMAFIKVTLTRIIDTAFPTHGEFQLTDTSGEVVVIHEKLPVMGVDMSAAEPKLPIEVKMACSVTSKTQVDVLIDTNIPHGIADVHGQTQFRVSADKLID